MAPENIYQKPLAYSFYSIFYYYELIKKLQSTSPVVTMKLKDTCPSHLNDPSLYFSNIFLIYYFFFYFYSSFYFLVIPALYRYIRNYVVPHTNVSFVDREDKYFFHY